MKKHIDTRTLRAQLTAKQQTFLRANSQRLHDYPPDDPDDDKNAVRTCLACGAVVTITPASTFDEAWRGCLPVVNVGDLLEIAQTRSAATYTNAVSKLTLAGEPIDNVLAFLKGGF